MFYFTKMTEYETENKGDLTVVFKNGSTYVYKGVLFEDYILLVAGGTDGSNGRTLNKLIKPKYEYERIGDTSISELEEELNELIRSERESSNEKEHTYFISGHRDITDEEFDCNYVTILDRIMDDSDARFVVGDCNGVDIMAQNLLMDEFGLDPERITVYHMFESPRNINPKITKTVGGFKSDDERDEAMTNASAHDIAFVRDWKKLSGTAQNILRRHKFLE
jgi:hypothetical protein